MASASHSNMAATNQSQDSLNDSWFDITDTPSIKPVKRTVKKGPRTNTKSVKAAAKAAGEGKRTRSPGSTDQGGPLKKLQFSTSLGEIKSFIMTTISETMSGAISEAIAPLKTEINKLTLTVAIKNDECAKLKSKIYENQKTIVSLEEKLDRQEQYSRRSSIRLNNVKISEWEPHVSTEVVKMAHEIGADINTEKIVKAHRVGRVKDDGTGQIIVKLNNEKTRDELLKLKKKLRGTENFADVWMSEDLTKIRSDLFAKMRQLKREKRVKEVWTFNGVISYKLDDDTRHSLQTVREYEALLDEV
jgi:hypothetical protein